MSEANVLGKSDLDKAKTSSMAELSPPEQANREEKAGFFSRLT